MRIDTRIIEAAFLCGQSNARARERETLVLMDSISVREK